MKYQDYYYKHIASKSDEELADTHCEVFWDIADYERANAEAMEFIREVSKSWSVKRVELFDAARWMVSFFLTDDRADMEEDFEAWQKKFYSFDANVK